MADKNGPAPMNTGVAFTGVPSLEELRSAPGVPPADRLGRGPVAVIECFQEIPCNPCEEACNRGAISIGEPITNLPRLDPDLCTGCGLCLPACPGLAIFLVDGAYSHSESLVTFPHEYLPLPAPGDRATAVNRSGEPVAEATVIRVRRTPKMDGTALVTVAVPRELAMEVRGIARRPARH